MKDSELRLKILNWLQNNASSDLSAIIFANQNAPRPSYPFMTMHILSKEENEHADIPRPNDLGVTTISKTKNFTVSVQSFGPGSLDIMDDLRRTLEKVTVTQDLRSDGIAFIRVVSGVNDLSDTVDTEFEERAGMDVQFRTTAIVTDTVGVIESVDVTGINETGESTQITETINIGA